MTELEQEGAQDEGIDYLGTVDLKMTDCAGAVGSQSAGVQEGQSRPLYSPDMDICEEEIEGAYEGDASSPMDTCHDEKQPLAPAQGESAEDRMSRLASKRQRQIGRRLCSSGTKFARTVLGSASRYAASMTMDWEF
jgi:hypothetical protein